jgi:anti-sigma B factor antagonist
MVLTLIRDQLPGVTVVGVHGELDLLTAEVFEDGLQGWCRPGGELIINLAWTGFVDCSGIRALTRANRRVRHEGGLVRLAAPQPGPAKIIRLTKLDAELPVHPSVRDAIGAAFHDQGGHPTSPADDQ